MIGFEQKQAAQVRNIVLLTGVVTTLFVWLSLADPINLPKMFILSICAAWVIGQIVTKIFYLKDRRLSVGQWAIVGFALCTVLAGLLTDVKYSAFYGEMQRNNGAFSYLALAGITFAAMMSFTSANIGQLRNWILVVGFVLTAFGLVQTFGHDPFTWVLLYNPVVGTLGNPDFFSGIVGAVAVASVWLILREEELRFRAMGLALLLVELFILKRCGSIQGLIAFALGSAFLLIAWLWQTNRKAGVAACFLTALGFALLVLGLLNKGPAARFVHRSSFQSRKDYWYAAWKMFRSHPWFGVGLERFGQNYGQYAPQHQLVQGQGTDNAHSVFLQLLATGGLLVILPYVILVSVIFVSTVRRVRQTVGGERIDLVALFSIWLALLFISAISIDNLGVAVWFWIIGGALYGVSRHRQEEKSAVKRKERKAAAKKVSENSNYLAPIVALLASIVALIVMVPAWRSSAMLHELQSRGAGATQAQAAVRIDSAANIQPGNIQIKASLADFALRLGAIDEGLKLIASINRQDHRSVDGSYLGAIAYEALKNYKAALPYRLRLLQIDPWSTKNMLGLITDYLAMKEFDKAQEMYSRLSELYPNSTDTQSAKVLIKG